MRSVLAHDQQRTADVREAIYIKPLGNRQHLVRNKGTNTRAYRVGSNLPGLTFPAGEVVQLMSNTGHPGENIVSLAPPGNRAKVPGFVGDGGVTFPAPDLIADPFGCGGISGAMPPYLVYYADAVSAHDASGTWLYDVNTGAITTDWPTGINDTQLHQAVGTKGVLMTTEPCKLGAPRIGLTDPVLGTQAETTATFGLDTLNDYSSNAFYYGGDIYFMSWRNLQGEATPGGNFELYKIDDCSLSTATQVGSSHFVEMDLEAVPVIVDEGFACASTDLFSWRLRVDIVSVGERQFSVWVTHDGETWDSSTPGTGTTWNLRRSIPVINPLHSDHSIAPGILEHTTTHGGAMHDIGQYATPESWAHWPDHLVAGLPAGPGAYDEWAVLEQEARSVCLSPDQSELVYFGDKNGSPAGLVVMRDMVNPDVSEDIPPPYTTLWENFPTFYTPPTFVVSNHPVTGGAPWFVIPGS